MNQDAVYSVAVIRADEEGYVTVGINEFVRTEENKDVRDDIYLSVHVLDEYAYAPAYKVGVGTHKVKIFSEWAFVIFRSGVEDKTDLTDALGNQHRFYADYSDTNKRYQAKNFNAQQRDEITAYYKDKFAGQDYSYPASPETTLSQTLINASNANGWGGMPVEVGVSNVYRNSANFPADKCYVVTFEEPNNKYFTSITVYDLDGYMVDTDRFSINSYEWEKNEDGTVTIHFNCGEDAINNLITGNQPFNFATRNYGASQEVVDKKFNLLALEEVK